MLSAKFATRFIVISISLACAVLFSAALIRAARQPIVAEIYKTVAEEPLVKSAAGPNPRIDWLNFTYRVRGGGGPKKVHITFPLTDSAGEILVSAMAEPEDGNLILRQIKLSTEKKRQRFDCSPEAECSLAVDRVRRKRPKLDILEASRK